MMMKTLFSELKKLIQAAESEDQPAAFEFSAGQPKEIEVARSGTFFAKIGGKSTLTPEILSGLAARFDPASDHWIKIGHTKVETDTPDYGDVVALAYDAEVDRLKATIVPTPILVERNRKEGFRRVSMELGGGTSNLEEMDFRHVAFLGKHPPAISGLKAVEFASTEAAEPVFVFAAGDTPEETDLAFSLTGPRPDNGGGLTTSVISPAEIESEKHKENAMAEETKKLADLEAENKAKEVALAEARERIAIFEKQATEGAKNVAKIFVEANTKKIPMLVRKAGFETGLAALVASESIAAKPAEICFAGADGDVKLTPAAFVMAMFAAMPDQVTKEEGSEQTTAGAEHEKPPSMAEFAGADPDSVKLHLLVQDELSEAKGKGEKITYLEATRRVERSRRASK